MRVVSIDASTKCTGIALFIDSEYKEHTLIDLHTVKNTDIRLKRMMQEIKKVLNEYKPDLIVMEECLLKVNVAAVKLLSYVAGAIISWSVDNDVEFIFKLPTEWRATIKIVQGPKVTRDQLKQEAMDMVKEKFGLEVSDDIAEAILLGYSMFYKEEIENEIDIDE